MRMPAQAMSRLQPRPAGNVRHLGMHAPCSHITTFARRTSIRYQRQRIRRAPVSINALSANDLLGVSATAVLATTLLAAVGYSALPLLRQRRTSNAEADPGDINDQDIKWTVMGIISCLPFVNWTAWIFGALDDPDVAPRYYLFAALYALPLLTEGLSLDGVLLGATALCALHVQVERVAARSTSDPPLLDDKALRRARNAAPMQQLETDRVARDALPRDALASEKHRVSETAVRPDYSMPRGPLDDPRRRDELQALIDKQLQDFDARLQPTDGSKEDSAPKARGGR